MGIGSGLRKSFIAYQDFFVEQFHIGNDYRWNALVDFDEMRIESIESVGRTDINLSVLGHQAGIGEELVTLQTVALGEYLISVGVRCIAYQSFAGGHPQDALVFDDAADVLVGYIQVDSFKAVVFSIISV